MPNDMAEADADSAVRPHGVRCPVCRRVIVWEGNPHRPFCSVSCRLQDLGVWLDEGHRIAAEPLPTEGDPDVP